MTRPSWADVIRPKFAVLIAPLGLLNRVWLNALNASSRSWIRCVPVQRDVLEQRQVRRGEAGPADGVAAGVAGFGGLRERTRGEAGRVEPLLHGVRRVVVRVARRIGPVRQEPDAALRVGQRYREAGLLLDDAVELPAAEHVPDDRAEPRRVSAARRRSSRRSGGARRTARCPTRSRARAGSTRRRPPSPAAPAAARRRCSAPRRGPWRSRACRRPGSSRPLVGRIRRLAWSESYFDSATENVGRTSEKAGKSRGPTVVWPGLRRARVDLEEHRQVAAA